MHQQFPRHAPSTATLPRSIEVAAATIDRVAASPPREVRAR
jgi:hypothetical protein